MAGNLTTRVDAICAAIRAEVERHAEALEQEVGLRSVSLIVNLDRVTGLPFRVIYRTESWLDNPGGT